MKMVLQSLRELSYDLGFPIETLPLYKTAGEGVAYTTKEGIFVDQYILENHPKDTKVYVAHEIFHWVIDSSAIYHKYSPKIVAYATDYRINALLKSLYGYDANTVGFPGLYRKDFDTKTLPEIARRLAAEGTFPNQNPCGGIGFPHTIIAEAAIYLRRRLNLDDVCSEPFWFTEEMDRLFFDALYGFDTSTIKSAYSVDQLVCLRAIWAALFCENPIHTATVGTTLSPSEIFVYSIPYDKIRPKTIGDSFYSLWVAAKLVNSLDRDAHWIATAKAKAKTRVDRQKNRLKEKISSEQRKKEEAKLARSILAVKRWCDMPKLSKLFDIPTAVLSTSKETTRMNCLLHQEIPEDESWLPRIKSNGLTKRIARHSDYTLEHLESANNLLSDLTKAMGESVDSYAQSIAQEEADEKAKNKNTKGSDKEPQYSPSRKSQNGAAGSNSEDSDCQDLPAVRHMPKTKPEKNKQQINAKEIEKAEAKNSEDDSQNSESARAGNSASPTSNKAKYSAYDMSIDATNVLSKIFEAFVEVDTLLQQVRAKTKKIDDTGHESIYEYGNDASRAVSSELALLENESTKLLFLSKLAQHELLLHAPQKRARTSVVLAIDASGSMHGNSYALAVGYLLAVVKWMHKEKRGLGVIMFSAVIDSEYFVKPGESLSLNKILAMALSPSFGGTNFNNVLSHSLAKSNELGWKKTNIQIITDGGDAASPAIKELKTKDQKIIGMVTTKNTQGLVDVCDELYQVRGEDTHLKLLKTSGTLFT